MNNEFFNNSIEDEEIIHPSPDKLFYKLDDGRIWSVSEAKFVSSTPEDATIWDVEGFGGRSSLDFLIEELEIRNFSKGELASSKEKAEAEAKEIEKWLADHDYIGIKIATRRATVEEYASEITEMNAKATRLEVLREIING